MLVITNEPIPDIVEFYDKSDEHQFFYSEHIDDRKPGIDTKLFFPCYSGLKSKSN